MISLLEGIIMTQSKLPSFDELKKMAEEDPAALEKLQDKLSREIIDSAPERLQPQLKAIYSDFKMRCESKHGQPNRMNEAVRLFMQRGLHPFQDALNGKSPVENNSETSDKILTFTKK